MCLAAENYIAPIEEDTIINVSFFGGKKSSFLCDKKSGMSRGEEFL